MHQPISETVMETYPPRVRLDHLVSPRGNSRRAPSPPHWPRAGDAGALGLWDWGSENAGVKVIAYYIM